MRYIPALDDGRPQVSPADLRAAGKRDLRELRRRMDRARRYAKKKHQEERLARAARQEEETK